MRFSRRRAALAAVGVVLLAAVWGGVQLWRAKRGLEVARVEVRAAQTAMSRHDVDSAAVHLRSAAGRAASARAASHSLVLSVVRPVPLLGSQLALVRELADTAAAVTASASDVAQGAKRSSLLGGRGSVNATDWAALAREVDPLRPSLDLLDARVARGRAGMARWRGRALLPPLASARHEFSSALEEASSAVSDAHALVGLMDRAAASGRPARLLFLAQDSWELRPSGGFIGSYGILEIGQGRIRMSRYADATTLPDPSPPVKGPEPLGSLLGRPWQLTGAGWWADFPTSAKAARRLYAASGGERVDGVAASTQEFLEDLLRGLGSVRVPGYPETINARNVSDRIVHHVELKRPLDQPRKKFLIALNDVVFDRLEHVGAEQRRPVLTALGDALRTRHLQIAFNAGPLADAFHAAGWDGSLTAPARSDFFSLVDANLGIDKANRWVRKNIHYDVTGRPNGRLVATVTVTTHDFGRRSPINTVYTSYARVYAPAGARLVDADAHQHDVAVATERGLATFGVSQNVYPGQTGTRVWRYYLPDDVTSDGTYRLLVRRQPGTPGDTLRVSIRLGDRSVERTLDPSSGDTTVSLRAVPVSSRHASTSDDSDLAWNPVAVPTRTGSSCVVTIPPYKAPKAATPAQRRQALKQWYAEQQPYIRARKKALHCDHATIRTSPK